MLESLPQVRSGSQVWRALPVAVVTVLALLALLHGVTMAVQLGQDGARATWIVTAPVRVTDAYPSDWLSVGPNVNPEQDDLLVPTSLDGGLVLWAERPGALTAAMSRAGAWVPWLTGGSIALLLLPVVRSIAGGRPFAGRNARALALAAGIAALGGVAVTALPYVAAQRVIAATTDPLSPEWFAPRFEHASWPWLLAVSAGVLALTVWHGARVAAADVSIVAGTGASVAPVAGTGRG